MYLSNALGSTHCALASPPEVAPPTYTGWLPTITAVSVLDTGDKSVRATAGIADFTAVPMQARVRVWNAQQAAPPRGVFR